MNRLAIFVAASWLVASAAVIQACGGGGEGGSGGSGGTPSSTSSTTGTGGNNTGGTGGTGGGGGPQTPTPPALGDQIDRFGRPAINTALNHTFDTDAAAKDAAKDAWNANKDPSTWATTFGAEIAANLAIIDSLDATCGNQTLAKPGNPAPADRYAALAGVLGTDQLWIDTSQTSSNLYLGVEAAVALGLPADGGGRRLEFDVIDQSYSMLAAGVLSGVTDGVPADADTGGTTFPYLAAPH
jgi:hypothetical protein